MVKLTSLKKNTAFIQLKNLIVLGYEKRTTPYIFNDFFSLWI